MKYNFEEAKAPRKLKEESSQELENKLDEAMFNLYKYFMDEEQANYEGFGKAVAESFVECFNSATYGGYPDTSAQNDLDQGVEGFDSVPKKILK